MDASVYRGTREMTVSGGDEGTLLHAHAISFDDSALVPGFAENLTDLYLQCATGASLAESLTYDIDGIGEIDVIHVYHDDVRMYRFVVMTRANIMLGILAWVEDGDEVMFEQFVADAFERLNSAPFEDEILSLES